MNAQVQYHIDQLQAEAAEARLASIGRAYAEGRRGGLRRTLGRLLINVGCAIEGPTCSADTASRAAGA